MSTIHAVYLADIKFGELECNASWWTLSLVKKDNIECILFD